MSSKPETYLENHLFALIGEVGLDKQVRLPAPWTEELLTSRDETLTPGTRGRPTPVSLSSEYGAPKAVLLAQLKLAWEMKRAVSVHGVQCHGVLFETIQESWKGYGKEALSNRARKKLQKEKGFSTIEAAEPNEDNPPLRICLHSYSGSADQLKQYFSRSLPGEVYVSFSEAINLSGVNKDKADAVILAVPGERILVESDLHTAGQVMDDRLEAVCRYICELKGWGLEEGVKRLGDNWLRFVFP